MSIFPVNYMSLSYGIPIHMLKLRKLIIGNAEKTRSVYIGLD